MSNIDLSIHDVTHVEIESVSNNPRNDIRWQRIIIHTADGASHRVVTFLHPLNAGLDPAIFRRMDDVPRQPALIPE